MFIYYLEKAALQKTNAFFLASTLTFISSLAIAHFIKLEYSMKIAYEVFTFIEFWALLAIEIGLLCTVNKEVLGKETPRAFRSSLLQEAVLLVHTLQ
jgi:hypothetical protein